MDIEKQKELYEAYPDIFVQKDLPNTRSLMCYGLSCGDGWFDLIETLCENLDSYVSQHNENVDRFKGVDDIPEWAPREYKSVQAVQVKEKFGGLRFYVEGCDDYVRGLISMAESMSHKICEECGVPGETNKKGWLVTLCGGCREERFKSREQFLQLKLPFDK